MPRLIITENAAKGIERCQAFIKQVNPNSLQSVAAEISRHLSYLQVTPNMGRPDDVYADLRELIIPFGTSAYIALYHHIPDEDTVYLLAFRHAKEAGY